MNKLECPLEAVVRLARLAFVLTAFCAGASGAPEPRKADRVFDGELWAVPSWGDVVCVYGPGTDASMDSPEAIERTIKRWAAQGMTGVNLRTDLADVAPSMIHRNNNPQQNPRLERLLDYVDVVCAKFNVLEAAQKAAAPLGFQVWAWHPHLYSDGAPGDVGVPGLGRMIPWGYANQYHLDHPEVISVDRKGNKLWMVREYAYPGARAAKVEEFVYMAKKHGIKRFIACMRSEVNQLIDPPEKGDQFGFNQPVVEDMQKRYGVDILTDPRFDVFSPKFDLHDPMVENWRNLRGEYITQFYRELRAGLREVDPKIELAVTLSGDYAGPPLGNQKLDWRTWANEGLVDVIISPVFYEATFDPDAAKKGYLTHVRENVGVVSFATLRKYISTSKHPEIKLISGGAPAYFFEPPPADTDGWRCSVWYDLYNFAWCQRWAQWMKDYKELGAIKFLDQNFDSFPTDPAKLPPAGSLGIIAHDPKIRACPGGWYPFGDEASGKAVIQNQIFHGDSGNAVRLTSNGSGGPPFIGYHSAASDRSNVMARLDTAITNGTCDYSFWLYRESEKSGAITYLADTGTELDIGLKIAPDTGLVSYSTGSANSSAKWAETAFKLPIAQWQRFAVKVDFKQASYSAYTGAKNETTLAANIPYSPPPPRTTSQHGVESVVYSVPSYKAFSQVYFQPLGTVGAKCDLDEVSIFWKPDLVFTERPAKLEFADDFEKDLRDADLNGLPAQSGGKWVTTPAEPKQFWINTATSYQEGVKSVYITNGGDIAPSLKRPVKLSGDSVLTFDVDLFIRSDSDYPYIIPGMAKSSDNHVQLIVESADGAETLATVSAKNGAWTVLNEKSNTPLSYDCWMRVQLTVDMASRICTVVQQQIGQVAQKIATVPLAANFQPGMPLGFRIHFGESTKCVALDNFVIASGPKGKK